MLDDIFLLGGGHQSHTHHHNHAPSGASVKLADDIRRDAEALVEKRMREAIHLELEAYGNKLNLTILGSHLDYVTPEPAFLIAYVLNGVRHTFKFSIRDAQHHGWRPTKDIVQAFIKDVADHLAHSLMQSLLSQPSNELAELTNNLNSLHRSAMRKELL